MDEEQWQKHNDVLPMNTSFKKQIAREADRLLQIEKKDDTIHHMLIEELDIPYLIVNFQLNPLKWNELFLEITNTLESDLNGFSIEQIGWHSPLMSFCANLIQEVLLTETVQEDEIENEDSLLFIRAIPVWGEKSVYLMIEDRSLQKQFENLLTFHHQLESASHIAAGVAHELRNPLSVIKGFLQLSKLTDDFNKYYDTVLSELNRMNGIIEDFLSVSKKRVERSRQTPDKIMASLMEIIKAECVLHNVNLSFDLTETSQVIHVNESMIKQVMLNLLRNAIEAFGNSNTNRELHIKSLIIENDYILHVKDNGKGMPESVLNQIGKPFFSTKDTGTGIGIPLCKRIIEDHGGEFKVESTYNIGTTVIISLPLE